MKAKPFILFGLSVVLLLATSMFSCVRGQGFGLIGSTGFAHGCVQLDDIRGEDGDYITNRWGWMVCAPVNHSQNCTYVVVPIYAGAGNNNIEAGTLVGHARYFYSGSSIKLAIKLIDGVSLIESHLQASHEMPTTASPGLFNLNDALVEQRQDSAVYYARGFIGEPLYMIIHVSVSLDD